MTVDRTLTGRRMRADVGSLSQPPLRDFVEVFQRPELGAGRQTFLHVIERAFDLTLRLRPTRTIGHRPESIVHREGQKAAAVDRLIIFPPIDDDLHVVIQTCGRNAFFSLVPLASSKSMTPCSSSPLSDSRRATDRASTWLPTGNRTNWRA